MKGLLLISACSSSISVPPSQSRRCQSGFERAAGNELICKVHKKTLCSFLNVPVSPFNVPKMSIVNYKSDVWCYGYQGGYANSPL